MIKPLLGIIIMQLAFSGSFSSTPEAIKNNVRYNFDFYTQYSQFYLADKSSPRSTDGRNFWTDEAYNDRLALENGILGIGTQSYGHIRGELSLLKKERKDVNFRKYDHVVEAGIEIISGIIQILDCPNSKIQLKIMVKPGRYRVRIYSTNLRDKDGDKNEGMDRYLIEIWPGTQLNRKVLKQFVSDR